MSVKERIKDLRKQHRLTQEDMAKILGITPAGYSALELGRNSFDIDKLKIISDYFGVTLEYLAYGTKKDTSLIDEVSKLLSNLSIDELKEIRKYVKFIRWSKEHQD